jgi:small acid-soluble spore protein B (major beta-type SASP)
MQMARSNKKVVPGCSEALKQMKYEIAAELGLMAGQLTPDRLGMTEFASELGSTDSLQADHVPWERLATRDAGAVGGSITRRLVQQAEQALRGL